MVGCVNVEFGREVCAGYIYTLRRGQHIDVIYKAMALDEIS